MKDIAKLANVTEAAVSMALSDKPSRISQEKRDEIRRIAKELNYVPNMAAKSLATKKTMTIGVVVPDIENPFFAKIGKEIEGLLREAGYLTIITNSNDEFRNERSLIEMLVNRGVDGLIIALGTESFHHLSAIKKLLAKINIPVILIDRNLPLDTIPQVFFDTYLGAYLATKQLIVCGHERLLLMVGDRKVFNTQGRIDGFWAAINEAGLPAKQQQIIETGYHVDSGYLMAPTLLKERTFTGILATNDVIAYGLIRGAREIGLVIPDDLSIVGYDRLIFSEIMDLSLASIEQNIHQLVSTTVQIMIKLQSGEKITDQVMLPVNYVAGNSIKNAK